MWRIWWAPNNASKWQTDLIRRLKVNLTLQPLHRKALPLQVFVMAVQRLQYRCE